MVILTCFGSTEEDENKRSKRYRFRNQNLFFPSFHIFCDRWGECSWVLWMDIFSFLLLMRFTRLFLRCGRTHARTPSAEVVCWSRADGIRRKRRPV